MNKQEIIKEGYLEAYITGDLTPTEINDVEAVLDSDTEVRTEYFKVQKLYELMAFHFSLAPSPVLKRMIMENPSVMKSLNKPKDKSTGGWNWMMAASVMIATFSTITAFYCWNQWQNTDEQLSNLISQNLQMASDYNTVNHDLIALKSDVAVLVNPDYQRVVLDGTDNAPDSKAVVYWNAIQEKVYLNSTAMAILPSGKQYQLWALVEGKPVDAGVFDPNEGVFQIMKNITKADAFAVTVEPAGGSELPTLSTLQVIGNV